MNRTIITFLLSAFFIISAYQASATTIEVDSTTITVMNTADNGAGSLRQAVTDAMAGDNTPLKLETGLVAFSIHIQL